MEGLTAMLSIIDFCQHLSVSVNDHESRPQLLKDKRGTLSEYFAAPSGFCRAFMRVRAYFKCRDRVANIAKLFLR